MFPNRKDPKFKEYIDSYVLDETDSERLNLLSEQIEKVVRSDEFETLAKANKWRTDFGHCAVASCAMQILAWVIFGVYLDTYCSKPFDETADSHWYLMPPNNRVILDPTVFQFGLYDGGDEDLYSFYACGKRKGHPSRRQTAPYYTNSPPVKYIIDRVADHFGLILSEED